MDDMDTDKKEKQRFEGEQQSPSDTLQNGPNNMKGLVDDSQDLFRSEFFQFKAVKSDREETLNNENILEGIGDEEDEDRGAGTPSQLRASHGKDIFPSNILRQMSEIPKREDDSKFFEGSARKDGDDGLLSLEEVLAQDNREAEGRPFCNW